MVDRTQLVATARRYERLGTGAARTALEYAGGQRVVVGLGAAYLAFAVAAATALLVRGRAGETVLITVVLVGAPGLGLLYGGARLPEADLHVDFHETIAGWSVGGSLATGAGVVLFQVQPDGGFADPVQTVPVLLALGCFAGFSAGVHDARARTRARELAHRNRQLERTREELETTVDELRSSNERLEQFAYAASHDLQEPLRMVSSYLQLLETRYDDALDEEGEEYLSFAVDGADRMRAMIEGLLAYSRVERGSRSLEPVDLHDVLADVREDLHVRIDRSDAELVVDDDLPAVRGDRDQLRQVFQNLVDNAVEYGGAEPPTIRVFVADGPGERPGDVDAGGERRALGDEPAAGAEPAAGDEPAAGVEPAAGGEPAAGDEPAAGEDRAPDGDWTIAVRDDGIGIPAEHADRVFEVFERLHGHEEHSGTGIGLALCQRIVDRHDGEIWVESTPGEGSTFYVRLPAAPFPSEGEPSDRQAADAAADRSADASEDAGADEADTGADEVDAGTNEADAGAEEADAGARDRGPASPPDT